MRKGYIDIPQGQIHYREAGCGAPLLLLHQTPSSSDEYRLMMPLLAKRVRVIAMDTMGYGMSDSPPKVFEIADYARTVREFIKAMGISKTVVAGHHTGATIAVETAVAYPELVDRLILHGCPYYTPEIRKAKLSDTEFRLMEYSAEYLTEQWNRFRRFTPNAGPQAWLTALIGKLTAGPRGEEGHFAVFRYDEQSRLPLIKCPVLLLNGDADLFHKHMEDVRRLISNCTARSLPGVDALVALTTPDVFAGAILDFMGKSG
jgi:pimeloyl-ACP methyl ester carboxylesterase